MGIPSKKILLITILFLSVLGIFYSIPPVQAAETYTYSTDPSNPFIYTVDVVYTETDNDIDWPGVATMYHQVYLFADKLYLYYWGTDDDWGIYRLFKADIGTEIFNLTGNWHWGSRGLVLFEVAQSGWYNLTIEVWWGGGSGFSGTSIFQVPELQLSEVLSTYGPAGFTANSITIAYYNFGTVKQYKQTPFVFSSYFYYGSYASNHVEVISYASHSSDSKFSEDPVKFSNSGTYIIYEPSSSMSPIYEYQSSSIPLIEGYNLVIAFFLIGIYYYTKKLKIRTN